MLKFLRRLLSKPKNTYTPPRVPARRSSRPAVVETRAAGPTFHINLQLFTAHHHAGPGRMAAARRKLAGARRQVSTAQGRKATSRQEQAMWQRVARRQAEAERARQERADAQERGRVEREGRKTTITDPPHKDVTGKKVHVRSHKRDGHQVDAHERSKPE